MSVELPSLETVIDEVAELLAREPDVEITADSRCLRITRPQTVTDVMPCRVQGVGVDAGVRYPAVTVKTVPRGNVAFPGSAQMRAARLNPRSAVGAVQAPSPGTRAGLMIGSRVCVDAEVPWHATGRHLVRLAVMESGGTLFDAPQPENRHLDRAGLGVWRNCLQSIAGVEPDAWRVVKRAPDSLVAQPLGWPPVRGASISLAVGGNTPLVGRGFQYRLQMPRQYSDSDELAWLCDELNRQEWENATGAPHIGAWSASDDGYCRYQVSVPARLGRRMPDLPRQLLETSGARANSAITLQSLA